MELPRDLAADVQGAWHRFIAYGTDATGVTLTAGLTPRQAARSCAARRDTRRAATSTSYQVVGNAGPDLVLVPGWVSRSPLYGLYLPRLPTDQRSSGGGRAGGRRSRPAGGGGQMMAVRRAKPRSSRRSWMPSFRKMLARCVVTVLQVMCSSVATSAFRRPSITWQTTSRSRGVSVSRPSGGDRRPRGAVPPRGRAGQRPRRKPRWRRRAARASRSPAGRGTAVVLEHWESFFRSPDRPLKAVPLTDTKAFALRLTAALPDGARWHTPLPGAGLRICPRQ
jgi:hypothetical protein